jgi:transposase
MAKEFVEEVVGIPLSVGSVSNIEKELTETLQPVMEEIETEAQKAPRGNADETSFGIGKGKTGWLWVLATERAVLFRLYTSRKREWAEKLLGKFEGILTSDRWGGYARYPEEKHQLCWAHLLRDFKAMSESGAYGEAIGKALRKEANGMFRLWHRFKKWKENREKVGVKVSMTVLESQLQRIRDRIKTLLRKGAELKVPKSGPILKVEPQLWVFTKWRSDFCL